jgi:hypothetical protein
MAVLFGAAERQDGAVVVIEVALDLHPIHVADAHAWFGDGGKNIPRRRKRRERPRWAPGRRNTSISDRESSPASSKSLSVSLEPTLER